MSSAAPAFLPVAPHAALRSSVRSATSLPKPGSHRENQKKSLASIQTAGGRTRRLRNQIHALRQALRGYTAVPAADRGVSAEPLRVRLAASPAKRTSRLLAQGDSWFDDARGTDFLDCLHYEHGHTITRLAVAGSALNDGAYGPVPREFFGPGPPPSDAPDRITALVLHIQEEKLRALLLSAGGNDGPGDEFFSFINNSRSGLPPVNAEVLGGVVNGTFREAYAYLITTARATAKAGGFNLPIFTHGYDYPWPDGRGVVTFLGWGIGPWFDSTFNHKNYPNESAAQLKRRHASVGEFIDAVNAMLAALAAKYPGQVYHGNLTGTLKSPGDWANELHPKNKGFVALAAKIDAARQANL